jgi:sugar lactone lactonase YvrE
MPGILRLRRTAAKLEVWARRPDLTGKLDGLAFGDDGALYVNAVDTGAIFRIRLNPDGSPGAVAKIKTSRPLESPDGMRPVGGNRFIIGENRAGRLALMSVHGDTADVETLAEGFETPAGVTAVGDIAWVANGKLNYLNNPTMKGQDPGAFTVAPVPLRGGR